MSGTIVLRLPIDLHLAIKRAAGIVPISMNRWAAAALAAAAGWPPQSDPSNKSDSSDRSDSPAPPASAFSPLAAGSGIVPMPASHLPAAAAETAAPYDG